MSGGVSAKRAKRAKRAKNLCEVGWIDRDDPRLANAHSFSRTPLLDIPPPSPLPRCPLSSSPASRLLTHPAGCAPQSPACSSRAYRAGRAEHVDSRIALGGGMCCRVHVMNGFEVNYQRERGPVGPLTQPLHDILTAASRRGCNRRASWPPSELLSSGRFTRHANPTSQTR
jgi:hypothetical protein